MKRKFLPPPNADLNRTCQEIALEFGVSLASAHLWKKEAGIPMKRGFTGIRKSSLARHATREEWALGCHHVAKLLGVTPQSAWRMRNRLIAEGLDLPKLRRGRVKQSLSQESENPG